MSGFNFSDLDDLEAEVVVQEEKYEDKGVTGIQMGFIGCGQGGCRLAESFYKIGYRKIILFNTNESDQEGLSVPKSAWVLAEGMKGAGKNPVYGESAAKSVIPELIKKMNQRFTGVTHIIICVGAGGGTGTGSAKVIAETCKQWIYNQTGDTSGTRIGFIIALPARSESSRVLANTSFLLEGIMEKEYSPLLFVDNQRITQSVKANAMNRWTQSNAMVCQLFHIFNMMCAKTTEYDTFDPEDYKDTLKHGVMTMASVSIPESSIKIDDDTGCSKPTLLSDKVRTSLGANLLLQDVDITTATHCAVLVSCSKEALEQMDAETMPKLQETLISMMGGDLGKQVTVHKGLYTRDDDDEDSKIRIFLMFSGIKFPSKKAEEYRRAASLKD